LRRNGPLSLDTTLDILFPVIDAVAAAHAAFIVHRDLKPENIFLTVGRRGELHPKVLDFGISKLLDARGGVASLTRTHTTLGTPHYMSPEQAVGASRVGPATDQYALATILYECLSGRHPFDDSNVLALLDAIVHDPCPSVREAAPEVPVEVDELLSRALSKDPDSRFPSVTAFGRELLPFAAEGTRAFWARELTDAEAATVPKGGSLLLEAPADPLIDAPGYSTADTIVDTTLGGAVREVEVPNEAPRPSSRRWLVAAFAGLVIAGGAGAWMIAANGDGASAASAAPTDFDAPARLVVSVRAEPPEATLELDGAIVGVGSTRREVSARERHTLRVHAEGYEPLTFVFQDAPPPSAVRLRRLANQAVPVVEPVAPSPAPVEGATDGVSGEGVADEGEGAGAAEADAPSHVPSRRVRVRNTRRATVAVTLSCGGRDGSAAIRAGDTAALRVGRSACTVTCTGSGTPRCPRQLGPRQSSIVIR
jgi:serine/threonine-protein kinase